MAANSPMPAENAVAHATTKTVLFLYEKIAGIYAGISSIKEAVPRGGQRHHGHQPLQNLSFVPNSGQPISNRSLPPFNKFGVPDAHECRAARVVLGGPLPQLTSGRH